jgi:16S rRNA processing protein RimM
MGRLVGAFGVQGWIKVKAFTERPESLGEHPRWSLRTRDGWREMRLEGYEVHSKGPVAKLEGCDDRAAADGLRGCDIAVEREALGEPEEGTIYWVDLVGLEVVDGEGQCLGRVEGLFQTGQTSVMVVRRADGGRERMIPFVADYVKAVDRALGCVTVDWKADYDP